MIQRVIRVTASPEAAEVVADRMWQWGVRGIEEHRADDGGVVLSTSVGNDGNAIARALGTLDPSWSWEVDEIDDVGADDWKEHAAPTRCRHDVVISPAWLTEPLPGSDDLVIVIEPAGAFGLGDHPTTRSSMRALADELDRREAVAVPTARLLDAGCGTGALAILAARRGVPEIRAVDIADAAVAATLDNADRNGVAGRIEVDTTGLGRLNVPSGPGGVGYDVIVANILAPVLVTHASDFRRLLAPNGTLIVSGVLAEGNGHGHQHVLDALHPLRVRSTITDDGWATVTLDAG